MTRITDLTTAPTPRPFGPHVLELDLDAEVRRIAAWFLDVVGKRLRRRGVVVAMSGGIDSSVCAALAVRAFGPGRVLGLLLPERDSSSLSSQLGRRLADHLGIEAVCQDIAPTLEAIGCYQWRDDAIRSVVPEYGPGWKNKIVIAGGTAGVPNHFRLIAQDPAGSTRDIRLPAKAYLQIVAATNHKQRIRKTLEYFHADRLHYAVVGTPNRLEYDQGFFVKNGDGSADVKPIAHLYKTQVYALARHLGLPPEICDARPTTDTYSLPQGQDEFYFGLPYEQMDLALWARNHGVSAAELARALGTSEERAADALRDIDNKRRTTAYLHARPVLCESIAELGEFGIA
ncbi:MAG: NH(3)-dependent NAD(+) synthetase [Alphaproteobacteria bacterium]|nr:MAG: NH(3)-dependent NAD(+) synthetase [Alphaproteobacteria bacterium]